MVGTFRGRHSRISTYTQFTTLKTRAEYLMEVRTISQTYTIYTALKNKKNVYKTPSWSNSCRVTNVYIMEWTASRKDA